MCAFETIKSTRRRRSTTPVIRISQDYIYLNQFLNSAIKSRNVEIQVDKTTSRIRLIFKEKETYTSRRITKTQYSGVISFKGILGVLGLKEATTIDVTLEGNQATGTYKGRVKTKLALKVAKK